MYSRLTLRRGFSMVEMMVALLVLSVGMLGVASLFATSLNSGSSAISRMQAVSLANDLADRIRANPTAGAAYQGAAANNNCVGGAMGATTCIPADMAANDLYVWNQQIANAWPGGTASGAVTAVAVGGATSLFTYTIQVTWKEPGQSQALSYTLTMQL
jgi:type IV pilus assembly protein PilV